MNISYRHLQVFIHIAHSATFAEAALKLHITQPALSSSIQKMEEQLGGKLFSRSTRRVELTREGEALLPNAIRIMRDWEETFGDIQNLFAMAKGRLTIAAMPSFAESYLPTLLSRYHTMAPNINLRILDVVMEQVINDVSNGRAEIGFTFEPQRKDGLTFEALFDDEFMLVVNPAHPLAKKHSIDWASCIAYPFVMMNRGSAVRQWTERQLEHYGEPIIVAETGQLATLGQLINQGLGISIMPSLCRSHMENIGLVCMSFNDDILMKRVGIVKQSKRDLSVAAQKLWEEALARPL
ncbi:LysR family transcriptional regulator [Alteromonas sp. 345S023]|uniref:LysR family transcriptional regulator n=1 Tax=Alteromonas profundi TaxID=2696062 RepID=A0A7X5RKW7_9ALTE|nr:LysR family transcriptional regulator [Alteromonas profundi]NDV91307.1 LysR family transcriptional regulator [Alteromonas profundi]